MRNVDLNTIYNEKNVYLSIIRAFKSYLLLNKQIKGIESQTFEFMLW